MKYKTAWFDYTSVEKIAKRYGLADEDLLDHGPNGESFGGAYGMNIEKKLSNRTQQSQTKIQNYLKGVCRRGR